MNVGNVLCYELAPFTWPDVVLCRKEEEKRVAQAAAS